MENVAAGKKPPQVKRKVKEAGYVPKFTETWSYVHLPIDILLLTVESCDFLSCFSLLDQPFKSYKMEIGRVYFGRMGDTSDQEKLKVGLINCSKGAAAPGGSLIAVLNAVRVLQPKAVFSVGTCISLDLEKVRMGDVVISSRLTTAEGFKTPGSPRLCNLVRDAPYGWVAPLENPGELEVKVHCDGDILSQSLREKCQRGEICELYPGAVAIVTEGEGVYAAAYDANIEWVIVKGVASYFHQSQSATSEWMSFASSMAASVVAKMLNDPTVFREWPHYNQGSKDVHHGASGEQQVSLREYGESYVKVLISTAYLEKEKRDVIKEMLNEHVQTYLKFNDHCEDDPCQAIKSITDYLISVYRLRLFIVGKGSKDVHHGASGEQQVSLREYGESYVKVLISTAYLEKEKRDVIKEILNKEVQNYLKFNDHCEDDPCQAIKSITDHLISVYRVHLVIVGKVASDVKGGKGDEKAIDKEGKQYDENEGKDDGGGAEGVKMEPQGEEHYEQDPNDDDQGAQISEMMKEDSSDGIHEPQKEEEKDPDKVAIFDGTVTSEGIHIDLYVEAIHLTFPPDTVAKPTRIMVYRWKYGARLPPLTEHEAVVSNVIEISAATEARGLKFNSEVKLVLSHSAANLKGYELVMKRLTDTEKNEWEEIPRCEDIRKVSDIGDDYLCPNNVPYFLPMVRAGISKCSTYAVVSRLKLSPTYTITVSGGTFVHPDYPQVTITVPQKAVATETRLSLQLKVQEVPQSEFQGRNLFVGPILHVLCTSRATFLKPVTIKLPVSLRDKLVNIPQPSVCRVRIFFLSSEREPKEWIEISDELENPANYDGELVTFRVQRFSRYVFVLDGNIYGSDDIALGIIAFLSCIILYQPLMASFFAYFDPKKRLGSRDILFLICCPSHRNEDVRQELEKAGLTADKATSRRYLIPRHDKAFVFVSGGIDFARSKDVGAFYLGFDDSIPHEAQLEVRLISSQEYCKVEFRDSPDTTENKNMLSTLNLNWSSPSIDRQVSSFSNVSVPSLEEAPEVHSISTSSKKLKATLLSSEWGSTKGGLSTINLELAIQLAKDDNVEVCMYLPSFTDEDQKAASDSRVSLIKAKEKPGYDPIDWLSFIPREHQMDVVIGHGIHLGRQIMHIKESHRECKWFQVVHTDPEELGMYKNYSDSTAKGERKHEAELKLCREADQVVAVGPKLAEAFALYLCSCGRDQDVLNLTPGIFSEFADINQATKERGTFRVLVFGRGDDEDFQLKGYDIAARAVAELKDEEPPFKLVFVGAPSGKEEQVKRMLLNEGILPRQLIVRSAKEREQLAQQFYEADLVIMPSITEGFGLTALEALSAGLPVLVSRNSGLGEALQEVPYGKNVVLNSEDPTEWAKEIKAVRRKRRAVRLEEAIGLREKYAKIYQWEGQCRILVERMHEIVKS